ncbi:nucleotidyl transferase AbiEii/AbiGii toxin family protein [Bradyrhizobium pachyrhizi]|uniref:nucleotidyl transferase AbiEii/AbiGii toxin family protein n=1 Tax=Bradyrhizobium pachyrhizi TaxID=280333 RepID=UPI0009E2FDD7|nr:nucleotidyl transferase AbiEii/AbiGii toxin family protein [Bradyrhizobium pachyrhizi]
MHEVVCDAAQYLATLEFPTATPKTMKAERTFWEKATAIYVFCVQGKLKGERFARHWYDLVRLDDAGIAEKALKDRKLAAVVAEHNSWFFSDKDAAGLVIDYRATVGGALKLVPEGGDARRPRARLQAHGGRRAFARHTRQVRWVDAALCGH